MKQTRRSGFSLLEVILATAVLLGCVIVLSHISFVGMAHMDAAEQYSVAQLACQSRMNEILAGAVPIQEVRGQPIPDLPGWGLTVKVESASRPGLLALEITAAEQPVETAAGTAVGNSQVAAAGKRFSLVRWIAEPEGSEISGRMRTNQTSVPVDVPMEQSFFDDSLQPGDSLLPEEPMSPEGSLLPEAPELPEEPGMFNEPEPEF